MADTTDLHSQQSKWRIPVFVFFKDARLVFKMDSLGLEIIRIALPAALALAADPIASLIDTAFIGRLEETTGRLDNGEEPKAENSEKSSAKDSEMKELKPEEAMLENLEKGASTNTTTETKDESSSDNNSSATTCKSSSLIESKKLSKGKSHIPSASTALIIGAFFGLVQAIFLVLGVKPLLHIMGVKSKDLTLRSLGAPAVLLSLAMQGVFRGLKDTKAPLNATVAGDLANIILDPIFIFVCRLGVSGAAIAHVLSQFLFVNQSNSCDYLCHTRSFNGCTPWFNTYGRVPNLLLSPAHIISSG
ncbi:hypothetical protein Pint_24009 [Pistacia integerrima]|uniref:Uncharacterized protein n=1 Tax=Pistacia integerrima TaxID=434235 RepID=A0ACC0YP94_9ROSI|nr:hypothetical protein Pint_24009 [Pistacia integerrima]